MSQKKVEFIHCSTRTAARPEATVRHMTSREAMAWWAADEGFAVVVGGAVVVSAEARANRVTRASKARRERAEDIASGAWAGH